MDEARIRAARNSSGRHPADNKPEPEPEPEKPKEQEPKEERREPEPRPRSRNIESSRGNMKIQRGVKLRMDRTKWTLLGVVVAVLAVIGLVSWWVGASSNDSVGVDPNKYQAILLTNGEAYLGKLTVLNEEYLKLEDIFYLKPQTEEKSSEETAQDINSDQSVQLIKFGGEVQGPEDEMIIARDQVLYYQNLKTDGKASKAIEEYKKSN